MHTYIKFRTKTRSKDEAIEAGIVSVCVRYTDASILNSYWLHKSGITGGCVYWETNFKKAINTASLGYLVYDFTIYSVDWIEWYAITQGHDDPIVGTLCQYMSQS